MDLVLLLWLEFFCEERVLVFGFVGLVDVGVEDVVICVVQFGQDVVFVVELGIDGCCVDFYVWMYGFYCFDVFGCGYQEDVFDVMGVGVFEYVNGGDQCVVGGQYWVEDQCVVFFQVVGQVFEVGYWLQGFFIVLQVDYVDMGCWDQ